MTDPNQPARYRLRLVFAKNEQVKYIAHLDLALAWERALRRAQIPLVYSQGFNPRPKMQFASGLPLGSMGSAEIVDIIVDEPLDPDEVLARIRPALPVGIKLHAVESVPLKVRTMQQLLRQADYRVIVETAWPAETLSKRIEALLAADEIIQRRVRRRREEKVDLRPWLYALRLESVDNGEAVLQMRLAAGQHGNLRPRAVLKALGLEEAWFQVERTRLIFEDEVTEAQPERPGP